MMTVLSCPAFDFLSLYDYASVYFLEIVFLLTLVAITIFRREMSCNRCYSEHDGIETSVSTSSCTNGNSSRATRICTPSSGMVQVLAETSSQTSMFPDWNDEQADSLLEGAGSYCSGTTVLFPFLLYLLTTPFFWCLLLLDLPLIVLSWVKSKELGSTEDLLDAAGYYCSGRPFFGFLPRNRKRPPVSSILIRTSTSMSIDELPCELHDDLVDDNVFTSIFPSDTCIHILTFLHPKDIVAGFACTSKACYNFVQPLYVQLSCRQNDDLCCCTSSSKRLWKRLFERDYAWIVDSWDIGRQAKLRSLNCSNDKLNVRYTKEFYFRFGLSYLDYVLAGHNTVHSCLVGISGHIYDMTSFLNEHPGSSETVLVHAGRDQTSTFQAMRHTTRARRIAQQFCLVVDLSRKHPQQNLGPEGDTVSYDSLTNSENLVRNSSVGYGLRPTEYLARCSQDSTRLQEASSRKCILPNIVGALSPPSTSQKQQDVVISPLTIRNDFYEEQNEAISLAMTRYRSDALGGDVNVYYDPFQSKWKGWYISANNLENKFVDLDPW